MERSSRLVLSALVLVLELSTVVGEYQLLNDSRQTKLPPYLLVLEVSKSVQWGDYVDVWFLLFLSIAFAAKTAFIGECVRT